MLSSKPYSKLLLTACLALLTSFCAQAQNGSGLYYQAENLFKTKNYYEAAQVYERYLAKEKNARPHSTPFAVDKIVKNKENIDPHQEAVYNLATCYRMVNDYQKAEKYYKESIKFSEKAYPAARYWYAVTLRANGEFPEALVQVNAFLEKHTQMDDLLIGADKELEDLKFIQLQSERANDQFSLTEIKGQNPVSGYALTQKAGDSLVFTAITEEKTKTGQTWYLNTLFETVSSENPLLGSDPIAIETEEGTHDGMAAFTQDGRTMFFTRWTKKNNTTSSAIYMSRLKKKAWSKPEKVSEPLNVEGYSSGQPFLTADGRYLIFSSDRPGGSGGYDLWASSLDSNQEPIQVRNLGNVINTGGDEEAPYFHDKSRTLVFSTNGRVGMGGFDIFSAKGNFNLSSWEKPVNAGAPLNSPKDDLYYISTDEDNLWNTGWISSDRSSECCLALFAVKENNAQVVNGVVVDCKTREPLKNVMLTVTDLRHPDRVLGKFAADTAGKYSFELHNSAHFKISAARPEYEPASADYNLQILQGRDSTTNEPICLNAIAYPKQQIEQLLKTLERNSHVGNFAYKKALLSDSAHDNLDSLAKILKKFPDMIVQIEGYTDGIGGEKYNIGLAQKRVDACVRYLRKRGVPAAQMVGKAMGKCCPVAPETVNGKDNPAGREINRRVEYKVIKY